VPSRFTAALTVAAAGRPRDSARALWTWVRDGRKHPSPNSGQCEAAMAGALGVRLGGRNVYRGRSRCARIWGAGRSGAGRRPPAAGISGAVGFAAFVVVATARIAAARSDRRAASTAGRTGSSAGRAGTAARRGPAA